MGIARGINVGTTQSCRTLQELANWVYGCCYVSQLEPQVDQEATDWSTGQPVYSRTQASCSLTALAIVGATQLPALSGEDMGVGVRPRHC